MAQRRKSREVNIGNVSIGGNSPIVIQSMLNTKTTDVEASVQQIIQLKQAGCDLIRLAVPDFESVKAFGEIAKITGEPLIADIHYNYDLALAALDAGAKKIRTNPGNMPSDKAKIADLAKRMADAGVPVRVGVNGGSLAKRFKGLKEETALVESALECAYRFECAGLKDIVIAIKSSDTLTTIAANRQLAAECDYPLHLGVTEAGTLKSGLIKSSIGIGTLLGEGIGDTIRISLTDNPVEEVKAAKVLLRTLKLYDKGADIISCPTCARTEIDVKLLAYKIEDLTSNVTKPLKIAVMGCPLNGIGEGENCDIGVAGGLEKSVLLVNGKIAKTVPSADLEHEFLQLLAQVLQEK